MIKETTETMEYVIKHKYCDVCGKEINLGMACSVVKCEICHKDLCETCIGKETDTSGDYREVYCKTCWEIGKPYRQAIQEHENAIDKLNEEWSNKCCD